MGWVFDRPVLTAIEVSWRWLFGVPFLLVCWARMQSVLAKLDLEASGFNAIDRQNPWVAAVQVGHVWGQYQPLCVAVLHWLLPVAGLGWAVVSGVGRSFLLNRLDARMRVRPAEMVALQAAFLLVMGAAFWGWYRSVEWAAQTTMAAAGEPDLVGFSCWAIFLTLGFFTLWALVSWALSMAPILMLLEDCGPAQALARCLRLGRPFTGKLVEINLVMGIVKLALIVLAMVLSAAPLPFSDELGAEALRWIGVAAAIFYCVANDYFQVVRLKGFVEFWKMFRGNEGAS
jgi:hypothetical protein